MHSQSKVRTGFFPGSFNPVHTGHLIIAHFMLQHSDLEEIWFVISPQNPLKDHSELMPEQTRAALLQLAIDDQPGFHLCERELTLARPSYTWKTLEILRKENPDRDFVLIIGNDNLEVFEKWKDHEKILASTDIYVYPRKAMAPNKFLHYAGIRLHNAPQIEISSAFIREGFRTGCPPRYMLPEKVYRQIQIKKLL